MSRLGLGYEELSEVNPGLIYCSISAFGSGSRAAELAGYDFLIQAVGGFMSITGPKRGEPHKVGVAVIDMISGLYATVGILAALEARRRTRRGQLVEVSLMDSALSALLNQASGYLLAGTVPRPLGNRHPSIAPYQTYRATDRPFALAVGSDGLWRRLCEALGLHELAQDERFATNSARVANVDELEAVLESVFAKASAREWVERLGSAGLPVGLVRDVGEAFEFAEALGLAPTVEVEGSKTGKPVRTVRSPLKLSETPVEVSGAPPTLGQHSAEVRAWLDGKI